MTWKPTALLEGDDEVWVTFYCDERDKEVSIEICSVEDLIWDKIGDQDDVIRVIKEALKEQEN